MWSAGCGVWKTRSVENKSLQNGKLNNGILNNDKFIDQTYTLTYTLNDDGFLLGYDIETKFSRIFTNHITNHKSQITSIVYKYVIIII